MAEIVVMPKLNLTMEEGVIVEWNKKVGEIVKKDEVLCSLETEKSVVEMESPASGTILQIWGMAGERYPIKTPIALIGEPDEDVTSVIDQVQKILSGAEKESVQPVASEAINTASPGAHVQVKMLPKVRKLAQELGIDLAELGKMYGERRISEEDVRAFKKESISPSDLRTFTDPRDRRERMSSMRKAIAANMSESCQKTARLTNITEVDVTRVVQILKERKEEKLSLTAVVMKACAMAIQEHGVINTVIDGDDILYKADINIGVAVDLPTGLVVPVIRDADRKDVVTLSHEIASFSDKANQGTLSQLEMEGGTFTITNVGMLAVKLFTPIINYPQTAIMGVGAIQRLPRFVDDSSDRVEARHIMHLSLTYDHRVIDGAPAARFSRRVRDLLQDADKLLTKDKEVAQTA